MLKAIRPLFDRGRCNNMSSKSMGYHVGYSWYAEHVGALEVAAGHTSSSAARCAQFLWRDVAQLDGESRRRLTKPLPLLGLHN